MELKFAPKILKLSRYQAFKFITDPGFGMFSITRLSSTDIITVNYDNYPKFVVDMVTDHLRNLYPSDDPRRIDWRCKTFLAMFQCFPEYATSLGMSSAMVSEINSLIFDRSIITHLIDIYLSPEA